MATISKRAKGWFVQIRRKGYEPEYRTFKTHAAAGKWARERDAALDKGEAPAGRRSLYSTTLGELVARYICEVTPRKRSAETERLRLDKMKKAAVCGLKLAELSPAHVAAYRDARAKEVKPGTLTRELSLLRNVIEVARAEWGFSLAENVVARVRRPVVRNARTRRLEPGEYERICAALKFTRNPLIAPAVLLAIETGLRRGELLDLDWKRIDLAKRTAHIPNTKTGHARTIPLTDRAVAILNALPRTERSALPLTPTSLRLAWNRLRCRAGVPDLNFHDLRHEAVSRFFEMGLSLPEVALISGHRDPRMLVRYTHLRPDALAEKLRGRAWAAHEQSRDAMA